MGLVETWHYATCLPLCPLMDICGGFAAGPVSDLHPKLVSESPPWSNAVFVTLIEEQRKLLFFFGFF